MFRSGSSPDDRVLAKALRGFTASEACLESLCSDQFYNWTGLEPIEDAAYDPIRLLIKGLGYTEEDIFGG